MTNKDTDDIFEDGSDEARDEPVTQESFEDEVADEASHSEEHLSDSDSAAASSDVGATGDDADSMDARDIAFQEEAEAVAESEDGESDDVDERADGEESDDDEEEEPVLPFERVGREDINEAFDKLKRYRAGDEDAREDIEDVPRRVKVLRSLRPEVISTVVETTLPLSLAVYSVFVAVFLLFMSPESDVFRYLTQPNRIGDLFIADIALIGFFVVMLVVAPVISRRANLAPHPMLKRVALIALGLFQLIPVAIITVFLGTTFTGQDVSSRGVDLYYSVLAQVRPYAPDAALEAGRWYYSLSPLGFSARGLLVVMFIAGFLFSTPYFIRLGKAAVYVIASSPEEFPDLEVETEEVVVEDVDPMDAAEFRPVDRVSIESLADRDYSSVEELLAIPDEMRLEPYPDYVEVKRYWVRAPYSYVCILKDDTQGDFRYFIVEPEIKEGEEELVLEEFNQRLSTTLLFKHINDNYEEEDREEAKVRVIEQEVLRLANEYNISVNEETFHKLLYFIERDFVYYGKIDTLRRDPDVEDISCDGNDMPLFVYHRHYNDLMTNVKFQKQELRQFITQLAQRSDEHISAADPLLDASLPNGSRIQMSLGDEITTNGSTFTIRLFQDEPFTPIDLIHYGTFSLEQMAYLWLAIENDKSLIFSGGTASGKTTSMNAISLFIPPKAKVVTIEDTREIQLPHPNWIPSVTRDGFGGGGGEEGNGAVTMNDLLRSALRQRPEYMIVGEIRGKEAETLFQAMSTGHTTYSTMHADTVKRAINRLTNPPINVPRDMISSLDIICVQNQVRRTDPETGETENVRRNEQTDEIVEINDESTRTRTPFRRDAERDEMRSNLEESHILKQIRLEQGMTHEEIQQELSDRAAVLQYLYDEDIRNAKAVTRVIQAYMLNKKNVLDSIEAGTLDPDDFKDITQVEFAIKKAENSADGLSRLFGEIESHNPEDETDDFYGLTDSDEAAFVQNVGDSE